MRTADVGHRFARARRAALLVSLIAGTFCGCQATPAPPLSDLRQVASLSVSEAARGREVRLRGVSVYVHPLSRLLVLQADEAGISIETPEGAPDVAPGRDIDVAGTTAEGDSGPIVIARTVVDRGP